MRIRKNGKVISLTESDLMRITRKVLREQEAPKETSIVALGIPKVEKQDVAKTIDGGALQGLVDNKFIILGGDEKGKYLQVIKKVKGSDKPYGMDVTSMITGTGGEVKKFNDMLNKATLGTKYYYVGSAGEMNEHRRYW